jgi:uncharacterized DUF497 family protein
MQASSQFEWDEHNESHIAEHGVDRYEAEDAATDPAVVIRRIGKDRYDNPRYIYVGKTEDGRILYMVVDRKGQRRFPRRECERRRLWTEAVLQAAEQRAKPMSERIDPIDDLGDIPANLSDEEHMAFLMTHGVSEKFLESTEEVPEDERPRSRTRPINVRFDDFTLGRLKDLAESRNVGYQTLLKEFVIERLYEEERRQGVLPADRPAEAEPAEESTEGVEKLGTSKPRDWQKWVYDFVKENDELLRDPDIDSITLSRLAKNGSTPLLELSREIRRASAKEGYPAARLRRMLKGYERLKSFTERALDLYAEKFGELEDEEGNQQAEDDSERSAASVAQVRDKLREADGVVIDARERFAM